MQFLLATAILASVSATVFEAADKHTPLRATIIDEINGMKTTWKAAKSPKFANATLHDFKRLLGTVLPHEPGYQAPEIVRTTFMGGDIPAAFDARTAFPKCANIIGHVRDQSDCGSCWAFGSTEVFNDRYCISTGDATTLFSPEDTVSCCSGLSCSFSMGCNGGQPAGAWKWFTKEGVSSGGDYGSTGTCKPYSMEACAHHVTPPPGVPACPDINGGQEYSTPKCSSSCTDKTYTTPYKSDKKMAKTSYSVKGIENMQREMMEKGSVSVAMTVYEDFETYSSGVYQHKSGSSLGGHAIKMIGWGVDNGTPYWICQNSWNTYWGEQGTFRILRGKDECGIESSVVAGDV